MSPNTCPPSPRSIHQPAPTDCHSSSEISAVNAEPPDRHGIALEETYRKLVEQTTAVQEQVATEQGKIASDLAEMRSRVVAIEQVLREVG
jgi:hypothetical protein